MKRQTIVKWITPALMILAALAFVSCESTDPVAIVGSNIDLTAQPNPVAPGAISIVQARVTTSTGAPEVGVTVAFSAQNGTVSTPFTSTDSEGRASTNFTNPVPATATVEARSGGVTKSMTINVTSASPTAITLNAIDSLLNSCQEQVALTGQVVGSGGAPIAGLSVSFAVDKSTSTPNTVDGRFTFSSVLTDSSGNYSNIFQIDNATCTTCQSTACDIFLKSTALTVTSTPLRITEQF